MGGGGGGGGVRGCWCTAAGVGSFFLKILNEPKCVVEPNSFWI